MCVLNQVYISNSSYIRLFLVSKKAIHFHGFKGLIMVFPQHYMFSPVVHLESSHSSSKPSSNVVSFLKTFLTPNRELMLSLSIFPYQNLKVSNKILFTLYCSFRYMSASLIVLQVSQGQGWKSKLK